MAEVVVDVPEGTSDGVQEETCESELVSLQTTPMTSPAVISSSNDQQESTIQQLNENNEYEPEDNNAGRQISGRVRKRT